jgi:hypothetical protein
VPQELGFFAAAAFLNSVAQLAENLFRSRLLLMQFCISEPCACPHSLRASFLQSCDTELLEEDEAAGGGVAVCPYACPANATHPIKASEAFIFDSSVHGGRDSANDRLNYTPHEDLDALAESAANRYRRLSSRKARDRS